MYVPDKESRRKTDGGFLSLCNLSWHCAMPLYNSQKFTLTTKTTKRNHVLLVHDLKRNLTHAQWKKQQKEEEEDSGKMSDGKRKIHKIWINSNRNESVQVLCTNFKATTQSSIRSQSWRTKDPDAGIGIDDYKVLKSL